MAQTNPKEHARRTRKLRRRELTRKLVAKATETLAAEVKDAK